MAHSQFYLFSLPTELLNSLTLRSLVISQPPQEEQPTPEVAKPVITSNPETSERACNICPGALHTNVHDQRTHFRSDWHRYNVKLKLARANVVSENEFAVLLDALEESISGSESSSSDGDKSDDSTDAVLLLMRKTKLAIREDAADEPDPVRAPKTALTWFHSPPSTQIGIYNSIFEQNSAPSNYLTELKSLQQQMEEGRLWTLFMVAGGHFAGMIVKVSGSSPTQEETATATSKSHKRVQKSKLEFEVLRHKTFHRYTTRRKQGGSQSTNDKSKGHAISAGATLRRYGEQALRDDIRGLISDWAEEINASERIWFRASVANRKIFWDYDDAVIQKGDSRIRGFPFPTRRPTQTELSRCLTELVYVKVSHLTEDALRAQDEAYIASIQPPKVQPPITSAAPKEKTRPKEPELSKEQEVLATKWKRILDMLRKGRLEALQQYWSREGETLGGVDAMIPAWTGERSMTMLHAASLAGHENFIQWFLEDLHANPVLSVPSLAVNTDPNDTSVEVEGSVPPHSLQTQTAYDIATTREVRDAFRRCAAAHPEWWDWFGAGHVPSALSREMEDKRDEKRTARRKGLRDKVRERLAREEESPAEAEEESKTPTPPPPPAYKVDRNRLGGRSGAVEDTKGLTEEMKMRVERERRAKAAEARLKGR